MSDKTKLTPFHDPEAAKKEREFTADEKAVRERAEQKGITRAAAAAELAKEKAKQTE